MSTMVNYQQRYKKVPPTLSKAKGDTMEKCNIAHCELKKYCRGMCNRHYLQMQRHGKVLENTIYDRRSAILDGNTAKLPLGINAKNGYALVDKELAKLDKYNWSLGKVGYPQTNISSKMILLHQLLLAAPKGMFTDHINGNKLDNRIDNLRLADSKQSVWNRRITKRNTTGYIGVKWNKVNNNWNARITHEGKSVHIGVFNTAIDAARAYNQKAKELRGEYAVLNAL